MRVMEVLKLMEVKESNMIKMKQKLFVGVILVGSLVLTFKLFDKKAPLVKEPTPLETSAFFVTLPLTQFTPLNIPRLDVEIEGKEFIMGLDLGFQCEASLVTSLLPKIKNKTFQRTVTMCGAKGQLHKLSRYTIPLMKMGSLRFPNLSLDELTQSEQEEGVIQPNKYPILKHGMLGWVLFTNYVLFLDLRNSNIIIADSIETFKQCGPSLEGFNKTALLTQRKLLECEVMTTEGPLLCMIDTGCTNNLIFTSNPKGKSIQELYKEKENFTTFTAFQIGEKEFGATTFRPNILKTLS